MPATPLPHTDGSPFRASCIVAILLACRHKRFHDSLTPYTVPSRTTALACPAPLFHPHYAHTALNPHADGPPNPAPTCRPRLRPEAVPERRHLDGQLLLGQDAVHVHTAQGHLGSARQAQRAVLDRVDLESRGAQKSGIRVRGHQGQHNTKWL